MPTSCLFNHGFCLWRCLTDKFTNKVSSCCLNDMAFTKQAHSFINFPQAGVQR